MKTIQTILFLLAVLFSPTTPPSFGQTPVAATFLSVANLGSVKLTSTDVGIEWIGKIIQSMENDRIKLLLDAHLSQVNTPVKVEFLACRISHATNMSNVVSLLRQIGYRPATFEEAGSIRQSTPSVAGRRIYILGTQIRICDGHSLMFTIEYPADTTEKTLVSPIISADPARIMGSVVLATVKIK